MERSWVGNSLYSEYLEWRGIQMIKASRNPRAVKVSCERENGSFWILLLRLPWRVQGLHPGHQLCAGFYYWVSLWLSHYGQEQILSIQKQYCGFLMPRQGYGRLSVPLKVGLETFYMGPLPLHLCCLFPFPEHCPQLTVMLDSWTYLWQAGYQWSIKSMGVGIRLTWVWILTLPSASCVGKWLT